MRPINFVAAVICIWMAASAGAVAQDAASYPGETIRIVVPFSAGGATDITARIIGQKLAEEWKATVVIENKPGATGSIAADYVAKSKPDGHILLMGTGSVNSVFPAVK